MDIAQLLLECANPSGLFREIPIFELSFGTPTLTQKSQGSLKKVPKPDLRIAPHNVPLKCEISTILDPNIANNTKPSGSSKLQRVARA